MITSGGGFSSQKEKYVPGKKGNGTTKAKAKEERRTEGCKHQ